MTLPPADPFGLLSGIVTDILTRNGWSCFVKAVDQAGGRYIVVSAMHTMSGQIRTEALISTWEIAENPYSFQDIVMTRLCERYNIQLPSEVYSFDPVLKDVMEGRGLEAFMED